MRSCWVFETKHSRLSAVKSVNQSFVFKEVLFILSLEMTEMASVSPSSRDPGEFHPREAREQFRQNRMTHISCGQFCAGYLQSNIACVPSNMADDFERLCISNSSPFPLLYRSRPGEVWVPPLASESDVRLVEANRCDKAKKETEARLIYNNARLKIQRSLI